MGSIERVLGRAVLGCLLLPASHGAGVEGLHRKTFDVVVYGATPSGVMAATAAAQMGMRVALVEPGNHVGGMVSGGLSHTDIDRQENLVGGLTQKFFHQIAVYYGLPNGWSFEPHVAEETFHQFLNQAHVQLFTGEQIERLAREGPEITTLESKKYDEFNGKIFIDSSYEGDLMEMAGVSYTVGREGRDKYGESLAGRMDLLPSAHQFSTTVASDHLIVTAIPADRAEPHITPQDKIAMTGQGDGRFQSYCYRLILTDDPADRIAITAPDSYRPENYALLKRYIQSKPDLKLGGVLGINRIPNRKADVNSNGPVSLDFLGANLRYPDGSVELRQRIADAHLHWAQGLLYFLQNDPSVPRLLQEDARKWGLPRDEFKDTNHWPNQLYVREGRRMLGEYVLTQADLQENRIKPDVIGVAGYNIDIREVQWLSHAVYWFPTVKYQVFTEGYLSQPVEPWEIPFRALLPKAYQASNLLVSVCISASTIAYGSFRVEPTYMVAGESAGVAAALSIRTSMNLHHLDIGRLQEILKSRGQILTVHPGLLARSSRP